MRDAERAVIELLKKMAADTGFVWSARQGELIRKEAFGYCGVSMDREPEGSGVDTLAPLLTLRHDVVEPPVMKLGIVYGTRSQATYPTIMRSLKLFRLHGSAGYVCWISKTTTDDEVQAIANKFDSLLRTDGREFFDRYSSLAECANGLNYPVETWDHPLFNHFHIRAFQGISAAWFARTECIDQLASRYLAYSNDLKLRCMFGDFSEKVASLVQDLKTNYSSH